MRQERKYIKIPWISRCGSSVRLQADLGLQGGRSRSQVFYGRVGFTGSRPWTGSQTRI